jgi:hypothetical protein
MMSSENRFALFGIMLYSKPRERLRHLRLHPPSSPAHAGSMRHAVAAIDGIAIPFSLMVRRRASAVSNHETVARGLILRDAR